MRLLLSLLLFPLLISSACLAQNLKTSFSKETILKGKHKGYSDEFIGETKDNLYLLMWQRSDRAIQVFDKSSLTAGKKLRLKPKSSSAWYWSYRVLKSGILVLYIDKNKDDRKLRDVYATKYDWDLRPVYSYKKISSYDPRIEDFTIKSQQDGDKIALLRQKYVEEGEAIVLEYQIVNDALEQETSGEQKLDVASKIKLKKARKRNLSVIYKFEYTPSNELVAALFESKEDDPMGSYFLEFINVEKQTISSERIKLWDEAFFEYLNVTIDGNELIVTGFYSNSKEKSKLLSSKTTKVSSSGMDGTFFRRYNLKSHELLSSQQSPFTDEMLYRINSQNPAQKRQIKKNKKRGDFDDDISDEYAIRRVFYNPEKKTATFYCEYTNNYSVTTTTRNGNVTTTTTTYYSERGSLFYFEMSMENGDINFVNSIRKYQMLSSGSSSIYDFVSMRVVQKEDRDLVLFFTDRIYNELDKEDLSGENFKTKMLKQDYIAASIDSRNGNYELDMPQMSNKKLKSQQKVQFGKVLVSEYDNAFYTVNSGSKLNVGFAIACAVPVVVGWFVWLLSPNTRSHEVYTISRIEY